jgi:hypothetical protein
MDTDKDEQAREEIRRKLERSRDELIGDAAKPLEEQRRAEEEEPLTGPPPTKTG